MGIDFNRSLKIELNPNRNDRKKCQMLAALSLSVSAQMRWDILGKDVINASCSIVNGAAVIKDGYVEGADVHGFWEDSVNKSGWYKMHIVTNENTTISDSDIMYCAGAVEGYLSHDRILNHFNLVFDINEWDRTRKYPVKIREFLEKNLRYVRQSVESYPDEEYWRQIGLIMKQFDGLVSGYKTRDGGVETMDEFDHWFLQSEGDMFDLTEIFPDEKQPGNNAPVKKHERLGPGNHCSGMIRLLPDYSDIYFSHDAWTDYRELHGELKEYDLKIKSFKADRITLSTRVGKLSSFDDFYINDRGLFILETTLSNFNEELYEAVVPQRLFTWMRATFATWNSENGQEWTENFIRHQSGTYNNQYLIIDSKVFEAGKKPTNNLLWIIEQLPTTNRSADITDVLVKDGYFASINTPWFEDLFNLAGFPEKIASWGDDGNYWDLKTSARWLLAERELPYINTFEKFQAFMRYNNYKRDIVQNGDPGQGISARYDLREGLGEHFVKKPFGGLDSKALKLTEAKVRMFFHGIASPVTVENHTFSFDDWPELKHDGLIAGPWNFNWTTFESLRNDHCSLHDNEKKCHDDSGCGWCTYTQKCYPGTKAGPIFEKCEAGWSTYEPLPSWAVPVIASVSVVVLVFVSVLYAIHFLNARKKVLL